MEITKQSTLTGKQHTMHLDVTAEQLEIYREGRVLIQNVFPNLAPSEREFIKTGITPAEWAEEFGSIG